MAHARRSKARYHHGDLRAALLAQSLDLVEEVGAERFSLREAARLLGVTANATYRHFADRSALLSAVADVGFRLQTDCIAQAMSAVADTPKAARAVERLKAAGRGYVEFAVAHPELLRVMFGAQSSFGPREGPRAASYALLSGALDDLARAGLLPAARRPGAELKAWTVVHGFAWLVIQDVGALRRRSARAAALDAILDFAIVGLCGRLEAPRRDRARAKAEAKARRGRRRSQRPPRG